MSIMTTNYRSLIVFLLVLVTTPVIAENKNETQQDRDTRMAWWREAKFGMFVHWGIYSTTGGLYKGNKLPNSAEWMMNKGRIPIAEYEQYAAQFNPAAFHADEFVGLAKQAGMKYLVITAKHHDGFSMFGSQCSPYNVVDATPFGRDIMKELADACQKQGIRFGFYYSQAQDWHHPGGMGNSWDKTIQRVSTDEYVMQKAVPEVRQLLTDYGPIGIFWWDTPRAMSQESFDSLHSLTKLQTNVITNDRLGEDYPGDYKTYERQIPAQAPVGKDWEVCMPISGSWGYKIGDDDFKSSTTLIRNLIDIASKGGNYLLNVSPTGDGTLLPPAVERLKAIGAWMSVNSESIYGTQASPFIDLEWGRCTSKRTDNGTVLYLHVFDWPTDGKLVVPGLKNEVQQASLLAGGQSLQAESTAEGVIISVPSVAPDEVASVVVVEVAGKLEIEANLPTVNRDGSVVLSANKAYIHNNEGSRQARIQVHDDTPHIGYWTDPEAFVEWTFQTTQPGEYEVQAILSVESPRTRFAFGLPGQPMSVEIESTGGYGNYVKKTLGKIRIDRSGEYTFRVKPDPDGWQPMNLRQLELRLR
ncbi:alpha-L-fucosidase [Novipirellula artificiosorum]|uniref:alpha-L-fucosidase n=1 Tax=Novipirellula artificiosorum TaxID=2528016 RepID=A0A5C6DCS6_9BACT|nr:alpha-L-fucosidase [Novipirellula artificiosorum]TWU35033.1 Alpha-L-fucosidase [Novipirellula artificiosorum]